MESTVAQKLEALIKLQSIDSQLNELTKIRGALPDEVQDLEDEIIGYETRIANYKKETEAVETGIEDKRNAKKNAEQLISKYEEQQMNVRNNREYDAITKEIELQQLEIQISEKKINESYESIKSIEVLIEETKALLDERNKDLASKKSELEVIIAESEEEEQKFMKHREKATKNIEERLLKSYTKIRNNAKNGLAVVSIKRGACGGCFNIAPPQRQAEVRERKKLIVCEHCGRILADVEDVVEEPEKKKRTRATTSRAKK
jgi:predicted  nucleic acid-binding Zn-ribbon protein